MTERHIFIFLVQIFLLLGMARGLGELFGRWKQPALTAEILVGFLLGPTVFGRFFPSLHLAVFPLDGIQQNMLETTAWLGLLFFLLETGLEVDFSSAWRYRGEALTIALVDIAVPFIISFGACMLLPDSYLADPGQRMFFALFMAIAMTISAMPIAARVLPDFSLTKTDLGLLIMSALSVNDIIGWFVFTLVLGVFMQGGVDVSRTIFFFLATAGFMVLCLTKGRVFADFVISRMKKKKMAEPASSLTFICLMGFLCGAVFQWIGINALFGFFIAGVMAGEAAALPERTRQVISQMVYALFVPLFFARIGLQTDFLKNFSLPLVLFITFIGISARFLGAWMGITFTRLPRSNRLPVSIAHTPGGAMEIVVGLLALQYHLITDTVFVAIVCGAVISSALIGPWFSYSLKRRKEISILEFFSRRTVIDAVKSGERDGAIHELCAAAGEQDNMPDAEVLYAAVLQREHVMGTAIEEGIALPHARLPFLKKPLVVFGRSKPGIDWNSPDGNLSQFIFLILTPQEEDESQIQILRLIAGAMSIKENRDALMNAADAQELWVFLQGALTSGHIIRTR
jgi:Kef-type K+ transport system membrane component KefB/mannitol/fructose-specific phosphotransferase system IIA component